MWGKRPAPADEDVVSRRVSRLADPDLVAWSDQALYTAGRYLTAYQRERAPEYLVEAEGAALALLAAIREVKRRATP